MSAIPDLQAVQKIAVEMAGEWKKNGEEPSAKRLISELNSIPGITEDEVAAGVKYVFGSTSPNTIREPLAVELLIPAHKRVVTVEDHQHFRRPFATDSMGRDEIDRELDDEIEVDPFNREPSSRKSDKELGRLLRILDELETGKDAG
ncbi:MAG: hypothetical protein V4689_05955 [Verrucomicrobiota bacterium]